MIQRTKESKTQLIQTTSKILYNPRRAKEGSTSWGRWQIALRAIERHRGAVRSDRRGWHWQNHLILEVAHQCRT
jgi:hypothetical protein